MSHETRRAARVCNPDSFCTRRAHDAFGAESPGRERGPEESFLLDLPDTKAGFQPVQTVVWWRTGEVPFQGRVRSSLEPIIFGFFFQGQSLPILFPDQVGATAVHYSPGFRTRRGEIVRSQARSCPVPGFGCRGLVRGWWENCRHDCPARL